MVRIRAYHMALFMVNQYVFQLDVQDDRTLRPIVMSIYDAILMLRIYGGQCKGLSYFYGE